MRKVSDEIELVPSSDPMSEVKAFVKERERNCYVKVGFDRAIKEGVFFPWIQIKHIVDGCSKPVELRQKLAKYLIDLFGSGDGIRFIHFGDDLVLSARCGTIAWAYWLVAQQIRNPTKYIQVNFHNSTPPKALKATNNASRNSTTEL